MKKIIYILILAFIIIPGIIFAAPAPFQIAINQETKQCSIFNAGDEFSKNILPKGWESFYLWDKVKINNIDISSCTEIEECCKKIGLEYIKKINIKSEDTEYLMQLKNEKEVEIKREKNRKEMIKIFSGAFILVIAGGIIFISKKKIKK